MTAQPSAPRAGELADVESTAERQHTRLATPRAINTKESAATAQALQCTAGLWPLTTAMAAGNQQTDAAKHSRHARVYTTRVRMTQNPEETRGVFRQWS